MHVFLHVLKIAGFAASYFAAGVLTSFAEYKFDYSLFGLLKEKLTGKENAIPTPKS